MTVLVAVAAGWLVVSIPAAVFVGRAIRHGSCPLCEETTAAGSPGTP